MGKAPGKKRNGAAHSSPYSNSTKGSASNAIFKMKTDIGQHVLKNPGVAQAIVDKADLKQSDIVLEVGPGTGNLTVKILEKAKRVIAVELDPRMAAEVTKRVQGTPAANRLEVMLGDVVKTELPYFDVCISSALYSRLSVNTQMWATVTHIMKIGKNNFKPPPAVESSVVRLVPKRPRPQISFEEWDGLLPVEEGPLEQEVGAVMDVDIETPVVADEVDEEDEWSGIMDLDDPDIPSFFQDELDEKARQLNAKPRSKRKQKGQVAEVVREKVRKILEDDTELADKRARMCDEGDFLRLLFNFNKEGIHFS
ncbi:18S rRNA (adenine1779-N6/adenine1780-N6)-dimethyltransferase, partial [Lecanoromycetidae sp. Uapishka_2]